MHSITNQNKFGRIIFRGVSTSLHVLYNLSGFHYRWVENKVGDDWEESCTNSLEEIQRSHFFLSNSYTRFYSFRQSPSCNNSIYMPGFAFTELSEEVHTSREWHAPLEHNSRKMWPYQTYFRKGVFGNGMHSLGFQGKGHVCAEKFVSSGTKCDYLADW